MVAAALKVTATGPSHLKLELTESVLAEGHEASLSQMAALRALGCSLSLDDFGTGFSSLALLAQLPVDELKIDRSFVGSLGTSPTSFALVRMVLQLAQTMGLRTVAEGVETVEQADILRGMSCDNVQGYLFARPMPLGALLASIDAGHGRLPVGAG